MLFDRNGHGCSGRVPYDERSVGTGEQKRSKGENLPASWQADLDGHYNVRMLRTDRTHVGTLRMMDIRDGMVLLEETVSVSDGMVFSPDITDVDLWQKRAITLVNTLANS